jgi:Zn-finger nucleic acid-binding protein
MSEKQGIGIDYCPDCRGIWLDKGKLEKIVERSNSSENRSGQFSNDNSRNFDRSEDSDHDDSQRSGNGRKRNFFTELFD